MGAAAWLSAGLVALGTAMAQPIPGRPAAGVNAGESQAPREGTLKVGDAAPDFTLADQAGKNTFQLSSLKGKRPVVLIFGSYT